MILELTDDEACDLLGVLIYFKVMARDALPRRCKTVEAAARVERRLTAYVPEIADRAERTRVRLQAREQTKRRRGEGPCPA